MVVNDFGVIARTSIPHAEFARAVTPEMPVSYG
jgi:hypothetical protein